MDGRPNWETPSDPRGQEIPPRDLTVEEIVDLNTPEPWLKGLLAAASGAQLKEARRRLRLLRGGNQARLDQIEQEKRELRRRYPGIGDDR